MKFVPVVKSVLVVSVVCFLFSLAHAPLGFSEPKYLPVLTGLLIGLFVAIAASIGGLKSVMFALGMAALAIFASYYPRGESTAWMLTVFSLILGAFSMATTLRRCRAQESERA